MNEERIDVVVTLVRAVGDCPVEEYSLAVSPKCTVDKIYHMLFAEVDWLHDKKDEYSLALPDGAPLSVYFHRIGEVASIVAIHRAGQKARLLLLPNNIQQQPKAHTPPTIPKLSLSGGGIAPQALSLSPRGTVTTTVSSPRSLALVGSPRRHSFYPSSMFSLTEAEQSDIAAAKEAEIWKGNSSNHHNGGEYYGGRRESDDDIMGATIVGVKGRHGSGLKRSNTKEEMVAAAATATMEKAKQVQEENERLRHKMNELEQQAKCREEEMEERQKAWAKEKEELLRALEAFTQQKHNSEALIGTVEKEERKEKEKSEKRKSDKRKVSSKGNSHDGEELLLSTEEGGTPSKKKSKHKVKKASRSLKISEVKGLLSPTKHRKGSKTWDDRGDKQIGGVLHDNNLDSSNAEAGTNEAASDSPAAKKAERIKRKSKKEESNKDKIGEHHVEKGETSQSPVEPATVADAEGAAIDGGVPQQSPKEALERSGGGSEEVEQTMGDDGKGTLHERQRQGSFIIVEEDARIDEDLLDSGSDTGSGVKLRSKAAGLKRTNTREEERSGELSEGKIDEDEVEGNYNSEPEVSSDGGFSRRQSVAEFGSRGDDSSIGHDIDVDDEDDDGEHNVVSDEDSGREEWEGGKNKGARRALRFAKTDTTWSEMRKRSEKKKWLQEKKERTRTSRWEELLKEQQETLKALQVHSCEIGAIASSAEFSFTSASDLSMSPEAAVPTPLPAASEASKSEPSAAAAASGEPAQDKVQESDATGGVQAYKTHQIRRLWFRRKNTLPRSLEELSAEYAAQKKELDERARQLLEKRREKGEAPEMDEREREREKQERKALRLRLFGGAEASAEGSSDDETTTNSGGDKKGTRQMRALSVLIKKHGDDDGDDGDDGDEKEKKRSESTRKNRKLAQSGGSATSSGSSRKSGSMIASVMPTKDKIHQPPDQQDFLKSASTGERLSPMIARKKEKAAKKQQLLQQPRRNTTAVALAGSSPESTSSSMTSVTDSNELDNDKTGSHISSASTSSGDLSAV